MVPVYVLYLSTAIVKAVTESRIEPEERRGE